MAVRTVKYRTLVACPILSYGGSTGFAPIHVSSKVVATKVQNFVFLVGENFLDFDLFVVSTMRNATDPARAMTPPSLEGIERRIAYANRKYHSGWMWTGVTKGFAGLRFSTSPRRSGFFEIIRIIAKEIHTKGVKSLILNSG
jgi:hypothetical protein